MLFRFGCFVLILPALLAAGVIASVDSVDPNCHAGNTQQDIVYASVSLTCPGSWALAEIDRARAWNSPQLLAAHIAGAKVGDALGVEAEVRFDLPVLVTGTDQSGYLLVEMFGDLSAQILTEYRRQATTVVFMDEWLQNQDSFVRYCNIPFTAGVPTHMRGSMSAFGGALSNEPFVRGQFDSRLRINIYVTSKMVTSPNEENPYYIYDADWVVVPEPATGSLVLLVVLASCGRRLLQRTRTSSN